MAEGDQTKNPVSGGNQNPAGEDYLFFNVMPKQNSADQLVEPSLKIVQPQSGTPTSKTGFNKKFLWYGLSALALIAAGIGVYIWLQHLSTPGLSDIVVKNPPKTVKSQQATTTPAASSTVAAFPATWLQKYFSIDTCTDQNLCGPDADPDRDGLTNAEEFKLGTDPNNPDSDNDGLSDGDEVHVFGSDPLNANTGPDKKYTDSDYIKGGYDFKTDKKESSDQIAQTNAKMLQFGLHPPTIKTLGEYLISLYNFTPPNQNVASSTASSTLPNTGTVASSSPTSTLDTSLNAQQDRDAQRSATIKNVGIALIKYYQDIKAYPQASSFADMFTKIKPYLRVATNPNDPINKSPYVYGYSLNQDGSDFTLSFFSEVAGQIIKKHAADAQKDLAADQAATYDDKRKTDLETLRTAFLLYSNANVAGNQTYVFPSATKYKTALVPNYIGQIPVDPKTGTDYAYQVSVTFDAFTLKATLDNPDPGTTGYLCNELECTTY
ncbi:MAG: hypothetical protein KGJ93_03175 [Patescibacteria group bacterium]|nr:hypothetical protein [Patescibacteria group bacterium]